MSKSTKGLTIAICCIFSLPFFVNLFVTANVGKAINDATSNSTIAIIDINQVGLITCGTIQSGAAVNTLTISESYGSMQMAINDTGVYSMTPKNGRVGLTGGSFTQNTDIRYDDYILVSESCPLPSQTSLNSGLRNEITSFTIERPSLNTLLSNQK